MRQCRTILYGYHLIKAQGLKLALQSRLSLSSAVDLSYIRRIQCSARLYTTLTEISDTLTLHQTTLKSSACSACTLKNTHYSQPCLRSANTGSKLTHQILLKSEY